MPNYDAGMVSHNGQSYPVTVDDTGTWHTVENFGGYRLSANTKDALTEKIGRAVKTTAVKVTVPFCTVYKGKLRYGTATGIHSTNGNVLVTWSDGAKEQIRDAYSSEYLTAMNGPEGTEYLRLSQAVRDAQDAFHTFAQPRKVRLDDRVKAEIAKATEQSD
jgi:hypothetical protein